jgi:MFS family permease
MTYILTVPSRDIASLFMRWKGTWAACHRGYWLVASLYLVIDANLSAFQLVFIGTAQSLTAILFEVPAGVVADTFSRKWSLVISQLLMGTSMIVTGFVTAFPALVATQMLWGVSWTFASGADIAWITDELDQSDRIDRVLAVTARWEAAGSAVGLVAFGCLAWLTSRGTAIVVAGIATALLGVVVTSRFTERNFRPAQLGARRQQSASILRRGIALSRRDREILLVFVATFLVNGAAEAFGRLYAKRLVDLGFPSRPDPMVWYAALGVAILISGALAMRIVEQRIEGVGSARHIYALACAVGAFGLAVLAAAPDALTASTGVLLMGGVTMTVTRAVGAIWVNRRTTSDVRATIHSLLAQAEYLGEIVGGFGLALVARSTSISAALVGACALIGLAGLLTARSTLHGPSQTVRR